MHQLIQIRYGEETVKMIDTLKNCRQKLKALRASNRSGRVSFRIAPCETIKKLEVKANQHRHQ